MKKIILLGITLLLPFLAHPRTRSLPQYSQKRSAVQMQDNEYAEYIEKIPFSFSLGTITLADALKELAQEIHDGYTLPELALCMQALEDGKEGIDAITLEPLMPYIIKQIAPELLENDTPENVTLDTMITRAQRRESQPCSINKDWNTPVTPASCDLSAVLRLLCLIQKQIEICCREIKIEIRECCEEIIETITECCAELSEEIAECCEELSLEIEEVQETLEECCEEIQEDIAECCEEVIETITECCQEIIERLDTLVGCGTTIEALPVILSEPGNYILRDTFTLTTSDAITITASNVTLDLCGNIIIGNGAFDGIVIDGGELGITNVTIKNGSIDAMNNALVGENVQGLSCFNISVSSSVNGFNLINCQQSIISNCIASFCTNHGFFLQGQIPPVVRAINAKCTGCDNAGVTNEYNTVQNCKAFSTQSATGDAYGFRSIAGLNNTFIHCLAQDTRTDDTTNASIAAGFALGPVNFGTLEEPNICSECGSQIIECEISEITAADEVDPTVPGASTPVGILLANEYDVNDYIVLSQTNQGTRVNTTAWSPDGCFLASGAFEVVETLQIWRVDKTTGGLTHVDSAGHGTQVTAVTWSPDGCFLASGAIGGQPENIRIWKVDKTTGTITQTGQGSIGDISSLAWSPDSCFLASLGGTQLVIWQLDKATGTITATQQININATFATSVTWSHDGSFIATGSTLFLNFQPTGRIRLFRVDPSSGTLTQILPPYDRGSIVSSVAWSPDDCFLASTVENTGAESEMVIWKFDKFAQTLTETDQQSFGTSAASVSWSADGRFLANGGVDVNGNIKIWELDKINGTLIQINQQAHGTICGSVAWSPDSCFLASGANLANGQLQNAASGIIYPQQCTIKKNQISRVFGGCGGFGIQAGSNMLFNDQNEPTGNGTNLIINNFVYEADYGFAGVLQVYKNGLGGFAGFFDNIQVPPYCFPCGLCCPALCPELIPNN